ncbi:sec-independent protein translocase protein TatB [Marinospirillum celere]|uniref:Sec-independent protein translocase protein TatB n=1 Tax=Marinospirillum celere TaxID=1122252 RepID=A0A1I1FIB4_9GAMM|nr:Sec-independent protein translocase protein TatB [Marinospirillum celere]SFB97428.1 sec-independent protein translocase protein TatB [Marinospirillum celere]
MFDIGFFELMVLAVVGLLVLGPQRLPQAVRTVGLYIGRIRKAVTGIQQEVNEQLQLEEMRQRLAEHEKKVKSGILDAEQEIEKDFQQEEKPEKQGTTDSKEVSGQPEGKEDKSS